MNREKNMGLDVSERHKANHGGSDVGAQDGSDYALRKRALVRRVLTLWCFRPSKIVRGIGAKEHKYEPGKYETVYC
jgi:hypothetical protein